MGFRYGAICFLLVFTVSARGQVYMNSSFRYFGANYLPSYWWAYDHDNYECYVDTGRYYRGSRVLHIKSTERTFDNDNIMLYQEVNLQWRHHCRFKLSFYVSFLKGAGKRFNIFVNNACEGSFRPILKETIDTLPDGWLRMSAEGDLDSACRGVLLGFVAADRFDMYMGGWTVAIDGDTIRDIPPPVRPMMPPPAVEPLNNPIGVFRRAVGSSRLVVLGEATFSSPLLDSLRNTFRDYLVDSCAFTLVRPLPNESFTEVSDTSLEQRVIAENAADAALGNRLTDMLMQHPERKVVLCLPNLRLRKRSDAITKLLDRDFLGTWLDRSLHDQYKAFAFTSATDTAADSYEYYLQRTGYPALYWPIPPPVVTTVVRRGAAPDLGYRFGEAGYALKLAGNYDGLFYIAPPFKAPPAATAPARSKTSGTPYSPSPR